ncbi:4Fe-4S binding protein [Synergistes jonesii]|uniref:4Fe-4S binding protein n=1 Tax=Synergistes jonesii TaxID=2754 RepID=UPI00248F45F6|nr:4Fe-4S binding protein [Synergistes jonesii]
MEWRSLATKGYLSPEEVRRLPALPTWERICQGPVAVIECVQDIPCDPCTTTCKFSAITIDDDITDLPKLDASKCTGCGSCVFGCPGLAIFIVDGSPEGQLGKVSFPHEYLPLPTAGQRVQVVNRAGEVICEGNVEKVLSTKASDKTPVIQVWVPKDLLMEARGIKRL